MTQDPRLGLRVRRCARRRPQTYTRPGPRRQDPHTRTHTRTQDIALLTAQHNQQLMPSARPPRICEMR
eukprot:scaffold18791_cov106-Isochrysis_galbana.AAC.7